MKLNQHIGVIDLGWDMRKLALPLDKAHALQKLLLEAVKVDDDYRQDNQRYVALGVVDIPAVSVLERTYPVIDATCLTKRQFSEWKTQVNEGLKEETARAADIIPPDVWLTMQGD